jgi:transcriptional regulator with XRE-family HTH domain
MANEKLGQRIRSIRKHKERSLRSVAVEAQVSIAYLSKIEHDEANPTLDVLERLAKVLDLSLEEMTTGLEANVDHLQDMPESLREFIDEYQGKFNELLEPDWQKMLLSIRLRGRYPEKSEDWLMIFLETRRALG